MKYSVQLFLVTGPPTTLWYKRFYTLANLINYIYTLHIHTYIVISYYLPETCLERENERTDKTLKMVVSATYLLTHTLASGPFNDLKFK